jgi:hypothetical protein
LALPLMPALLLLLPVPELLLPQPATTIRNPAVIKIQIAAMIFLFIFSP